MRRKNCHLEIYEYINEYMHIYTYVYVYIYVCIIYNNIFTCRYNHMYLHKRNVYPLLFYVGVWEILFRKSKNQKCHSWPAYR